MASKTVKVESKLDSKFKLESVVGGHSVVVDQPIAQGGTGAGPTPLEYLLVALAGCIGSMGRIIAMQKRVALNGMTVSVEGDINLNGLMGQPSDDPVGFKEIRVQVNIDAEMSAEEKQAFVHEMDSRCPVSWNLLNASKVVVSAV